MADEEDEKLRKTREALSEFGVARALAVVWCFDSGEYGGSVQTIDNMTREERTGMRDVLQLLLTQFPSEGWEH